MGRTARLALVGLALGGVALLASMLRPVEVPAQAPHQPIAFSHKQHAGDYKIDCQYCHSDARRSAYAGIPSVKRCMGCHQIVAAAKPEVQKIHQAAKDAKPI